MIISPPFLPSHNAGESDEDYLVRAMPNGDFGEGAFPLGHNMAWHGGIHVQAPREGQNYLPVRAIADGTVMYVRKPKPVPKTQAEIDKDPLGYNGWADNGCVVIKHTTEIGEGVVVVFFSIYLHLKLIKAAVTQGQRIWRKDELGTPGMIDGTDGQIHFEIIADDANLALLAGRSTSLLPTGQDGGTTTVFGEVYIHLPAGTSFYAQSPGATVSTVPSPTAPVHGSTEECFVGIRYANGAAQLTTYKVDGSVIGTANPEQNADYHLYTQAEAITAAYKTSKAATVPAASTVQELLRFGRIIGPDALNPTDVPHWRQVAYAGGQGWVNLNATGLHKFSDADFPHWRGWQPIDDDKNTDSRCDSSHLIDLILPDVPQPTSGNEIADAANQATNSATGQSRKSKALGRLAQTATQAILARTVCKFPTEWEKGSVSARWNWLTTDIPPDSGPLAGPYMHKEDFPKLVAHAQALCFWEDANVGIPSLHWHFHPREFIKQFRKCGWLSHNEMYQLFPMTAMRPSKGAYVSEGIGVRSATVEQYRVALNEACRRYGIVTPLRMAAFYANAMVETQWFATLAEGIAQKKKMVGGKPVIGKNGKPEMEADLPRYAPWIGRGFMQLTWPDNYIKYWRFTGKTVDPKLASDLHNAVTTANATRSNASFEALEPRVPATMRDWRVDLASPSRPYAADSAGAYWAWSGAAQDADAVPANVRASKAVGGKATTYYTSQGMGSVAATVNVGHRVTNYSSVNGIVARFQAYANCEVVLLDTPMFPDTSGKLQPIPEGYTPRRP